MNDIDDIIDENETKKQLKDKSRTFRLTKDDLEKLDIASRATGLSQSHIVRWGVKKFFDENINPKNLTLNK